MKVPSERVSLQLGGYPSNEPATGVCVRTYPTPGRSLLCYREKQAKVRRRPASHFEIGGLLAKKGRPRKTAFEPALLPGAAPSFSTCGPPAWRTRKSHRNQALRASAPRRWLLADPQSQRAWPTRCPGPPDEPARETPAPKSEPTGLWADPARRKRRRRRTARRFSNQARRRRIRSPATASSRAARWGSPTRRRPPHPWLADRFLGRSAEIPAERAISIRQRLSPQPLDESGTQRR